MQSLPRWNKYPEIVSPQVVMLCKKLWRAREDGDREFLICFKYILIYSKYIVIYSNKLAYLQLITVWFTEAVLSSHEKEEKPWKIRVYEFIFRTCNIAKNYLKFTKKVTLRHFSRILFKSFRGLVLQNTSLYTCSK